MSNNLEQKRPNPKGEGQSQKRRKSETFPGSASSTVEQETQNIYIDGKRISLEDPLPARDVEKLIKEIRLPSGERLFEALKIPLLKKELEEVRVGRYSPEEVSRKERMIADIIQNEVSKIPYGEGISSPDEVLKTGSGNCVGRSILGGAYFKETGLKYLVGDQVDHSTILHVLSDGQVEWRDMQGPSSYSIRLTDDMIKLQRSDDKTPQVTDIVEFSNNPRPEGLSFNLNAEYLVIYAPEVGHKLQRLENLSNSLFELGRYTDAIKVDKEYIDINPIKYKGYYNLATSLAALDRHEEAIDACLKSIELNPTADAYYNLRLLRDKLAAIQRPKNATIRILYGEYK